MHDQLLCMCMYACMYVCMCVCMSYTLYVFVYIYTNMRSYKIYFIYIKFNYNDYSNMI